MTHSALHVTSVRSRRSFSASLSSVLMLLGVAMACSGNSDLGGGSADPQGGTGAGKGGASTGQGGSGNGQGGTNVGQAGSAPSTGGNRGSTGGQTAGGQTSLGGESNSGGANANGGSTQGVGGAIANGGTMAEAGTPSVGGALNQGGTTAKGGATTTGGTSSRGGSGAGGDCNEILCFRAIECVATCGGPVLQSGCCPCPTGTFDSIQCSGAGGASSTGGTSSTGGARSTGGAGTAGSTSLLECKSAADCTIMGDCCGCHSLAPGQGSGCPMECLSSKTCDGFDPQPTPLCRAGRCVLSSSCDDSRVTCKIAVPQCAAGKLPTVTADGTCYDGNCVDITECSSVRSCSVCTAADQICVYDLGAVGIAHCVSVPACMLASHCACYRELCGIILPCSEVSNGIGCGAG